MNVAGIDVGARTIKVVILSEQGIRAKVKVMSGIEPAEAVGLALDEAVRAAGIRREDLRTMVATGTGRHIVPGATDRVTEPAADARGVVSLFPEVRTVIDVGAEEGRGIKVSVTGQVVDFAGNEKCAAGSGAFTESMSRALEVDVTTFARISLDSTLQVPMNAQCTVFAESEVVSLIHNNTPKADIARAVHDAIADRIGATVRRVGIEPAVALIGGVAHNPGFVDSLRRTLGVEGFLIPRDPEFVGALGAALIAADRAVANSHANGGGPAR